MQTIKISEELNERINTTGGSVPLIGDTYGYLEPGRLVKWNNEVCFYNGIINFTLPTAKIVLVEYSDRSKGYLLPLSGQHNFKPLFHKNDKNELKPAYEWQ